MSRDKVYSVEAVTVVREKTDPVTLRIEASGQVRSSGWKSPELVQRKAAGPPTNGIYEFEFTAERPTGVTLPQMTPISASNVLNPPPSDLRGVRVHSETNSEEAHLK